MKVNANMQTGWKSITGLSMQKGIKEEEKMNSKEKSKASHNNPK